MRIRTVIIVQLMAMAAMLLVAGVPLCASETDNRIESSAKNSYVFKSFLKEDKIKINSIDGVVTLTGAVAEESHKTMAEETVNSLPGVKSVDNQLQVTVPSADPLSDAWLSERVRGTLLFHRSVSFTDTDVSVTNGRVTLTGTASSEAQKQLTTEYVGDVSGVTAVDNQLTIKKRSAKENRTRAEKIDDASITAQVRMSLLFHHGTDVYGTKVSTDQGVVTLTGTAKNQAEIDLASKLVNDIHGVKNVNNQMTIDVTQSSIF
ncbi:MAG: BON domain-containing protein [Candidatus Abyssobacteria bacterium SURF_17]|uniref:BON domain-containing protein n=1 Tax=Candidatus Abyssobacteria bacterium SURF_17 TaxID=2093361 RepID=A0A419EYW5_9BACT|nr:MAG: BON domain-containing protein [Candidatus Abyssubacteria bacterium SURF_17]